MILEEHRYKIPAALENVEEACEFVSNVARSANMDDESVYRCYLSVEEICTNVIEHGYDMQGSAHMIDLVCQLYQDRLAIVISDDATPFNPLETSDPDPAAPLIEREGGGWGIYFVKKYMDNVYYRFVDNRNQLTLEKML